LPKAVLTACVTLLTGCVTLLTGCVTVLAACLTILTADIGICSSDLQTKIQQSGTFTYKTDEPTHSAACQVVTPCCLAGARTCSLNFSTNCSLESPYAAIFLP